MDTDRIERETVISASLERVWEVLTHPTSWVGEGDQAGFNLREGETIVFEMGETRLHQQVVKIDPMRYISYRWAPHPIYKGEAPREGNTTLVEFFFSEEGGRVRLRVVESGFDSLDAPEDLRRRGAEQNAMGWEAALPDIKQRAEAAM
jgi:uncharacterized protein YndB with AHSA1/START domain